MDIDTFNLMWVMQLVIIKVSGAKKEKAFPAAKRLKKIILIIRNKPPLQRGEVGRTLSHERHKKGYSY